MTETPETPNPTAQPSYFSLILAEVIFQTEDGIASRRVQFLSQSLEDLFPADRLTQLQNSAAHTVREQLKGPKQYQVHEVLLLSIIPLGRMTQVEFFGPGVTTAMDAQTTEQIAPAETASADNGKPGSKAKVESIDARRSRKK